MSTRPAMMLTAEPHDELQGLGAAVLRASVGELKFDDSVDEHMRPTIGAMWRRRLGGFNAGRLDTYLADCDEATVVVSGRISVRLPMFRRLVRVLFLLRRVGRCVGVTMSADVFDGQVHREGRRYVTRGRLVLMLNRRHFREGSLKMSAVSRNDRWVWERAEEHALPRREWRYGLTVSKKRPTL